MSLTFMEIISSAVDGYKVLRLPTWTGNIRGISVGAAGQFELQQSNYDIAIRLKFRISDEWYVILCDITDFKFVKLPPIGDTHHLRV
jgi:hypothetical protein